MEKWVAVPDWEGAYEVSDQGRARSVTRVITVLNPKGVLAERRLRGRVLKAGVLKNGYEMVSLTAPGRTRYYAYVHDLVMAGFVGPKPKGLEVCHDNGARTDNRLANLRYDTRSANSLDRRRHGTVNALKGEACPSAKLTENDVREIRQLEGVVSYRQMGRDFGVSHGTIGLACRGDTWGHVE